VKLVDTNVLIYAVSKDAQLHSVANPWFVEALSGSETIGFCWQVLIGFIRLMTHPSISLSPLRPEYAITLVKSWMAQPAVTILMPTDRHLNIVQELLDSVGIAGNLVNDAHIAALAIEHGATVYSFDNDFSRFPRVRWAMPSL
jgi:uncharacterized protein